MRITFLLAMMMLVSCNEKGNSQSNDGLTTLYFMRHAEKRTDQGSDPELAPAGQKRAQEWVNYFFLKDVDHVLSSDFKRTQATATPLAKAQKVAIETYDVSTLTGKQLLEDYRCKTVVVYGHSNTINGYVNDLQNDETYGELSEDDYETFFKVTIDKNGNTGVVKETMVMSEED
ncbi:SixA phosphatase family protein [Nonlabens ponticola]|uniref:Phosphoglycerate mutase n=1 Tax=Nonlabens ponticola TaxID=2496866 RepID=A0A3S9MYD9_9FLAO|nr:phosphoglycerate mutase family protein [Nonlabens ponticola]AZQ44162.1 phosphoglycerate mutase [Nonlabens ponticola]